MPFGDECVGGVGGLAGRGAQETELYLLFVADFVRARLAWDLFLFMMGGTRSVGFLLKEARHLRALLVLILGTGVIGGLQAGGQNE